MIKFFKARLYGHVFLVVWTKLGCDDMLVVLDNTSINEGPLVATLGSEWSPNDADQMIRTDVASIFSSVGDDDFEESFDDVEYEETFCDEL